MERSQNIDVDDHGCQTKKHKFEITLNYFIFIEIDASAVSKISYFGNYDLSLPQFRPSGNNGKIRSECFRDIKK